MKTSQKEVLFLKNMKTIFTSISDDRFGRKNSKYSETQDKIYHILMNNPQLGIAEIKNWKWEDVEKTEFYSKNKVLLDNTDAARNGRAYKPFVIHNALENAEQGDYVIYNDCSPEIWDVPYDIKLPLMYFHLDVLHNLCKANNDILSVFVKWDMKPIPKGALGMHTHRYFTMDRCINKMGMQEYKDCFMGASGMWTIRKTPDTMDFMNEWLKWNLDAECSALGDPNIPDDYSYWEQESHEEFGKPGYKMGHRHDQSISSLLLNKRRAKFLDILHNEMNPYNFLQYTRTNETFRFIDSYNPLDNSNIEIGNTVINEKGIELKVFRIENGEYIVGKNPASAYATTKEHIKLKK